jgi:ferrous iron transport protein B
MTPSAQPPTTRTEEHTDHAPAACGTCAFHNPGHLRRLGVNMGTSDFVVALAGNPNTGKSTIFNALTGLRQHVGNWPGKTVGRMEGGFRFGETAYKIVDLPGSYSLISSSHHEEVARDFILFAQPDVTVVVVDATRLERNLILALQVLEITGRVVIALNLMDEARRHGVEIALRALRRDLGVPVIPMTARRSEGIPELLQAIDEVAHGRFPASPPHVNHRDPRLEAAVTELVPQLEQTFPGLPNPRWVALRLLDGDHSIIDAVRGHTLGDVDQMAPNVMPDLRAPSAGGGA